MKKLLERIFGKKKSTLTVETRIRDVKEWGNRIQNVMAENRIYTIGELIQWRKSELIRFRRIGTKSLFEITELLDENNLKLNAEKNLRN